MSLHKTVDNFVSHCSSSGKLYSDFVLAKMSSLCFPITPVKNHCSCRSEFTHKRDLHAETSADNNKNDLPSRGTSRDQLFYQTVVILSQD